MATELDIVDRNRVQRAIAYLVDPNLFGNFSVEEVAEEAGKMMSTFETIPVQDHLAIKLLRTLGENIFATVQVSELIKFSSNDAIMSGMNAVVQAFKTSSPMRPTTTTGFFDCHEVYEVGLYILLDLIENKEGLMTSVKTLNRLQLTSALVSKIARNIEFDSCFHTQEVALEIVCRFVAVLEQAKGKHAADLKAICTAAHRKIRAGLSEAHGASKLWRKRRSLLLDINRDNPRISSLEVKSLRVEGSHEQSTGLKISREIYKDTWLDLGLHMMTIELEEQNMLVKIPYDLLRRIHFTEKPPSAKILMDQLPERIDEFLKKEELAIPKAGGHLMFVVNFKSISDKERAQEVLNTRLAALEDKANEMRSRKMSVVSMKESTVAAAAAAAAAEVVEAKLTTSQPFSSQPALPSPPTAGAPPEVEPAPMDCANTPSQVSIMSEVHQSVPPLSASQTVTGSYDPSDLTEPEDLAPPPAKRQTPKRRGFHSEKPMKHMDSLANLPLPLPKKETRSSKKAAAMSMPETERISRKRSHSGLPMSVSKASTPVKDLAKTSIDEQYEEFSFTPADNDDSDFEATQSPARKKRGRTPAPAKGEPKKNKPSAKKPLAPAGKRGRRKSSASIGSMHEVADGAETGAAKRSAAKPSAKNATSKAPPSEKDMDNDGTRAESPRPPMSTKSYSRRDKKRDSSSSSSEASKAFAPLTQASLSKLHQLTAIDDIDLKKAKKAKALTEARLQQSKAEKKLPSTSKETASTTNTPIPDHPNTSRTTRARMRAAAADKGEIHDAEVVAEEKGSSAATLKASSSSKDKTAEAQSHTSKGRINTAGGQEGAENNSSRHADTKKVPDASMQEDDQGEESMPVDDIEVDTSVDEALMAQGNTKEDVLSERWPAMQLPSYSPLKTDKRRRPLGDITNVLVGKKDNETLTRNTHKWSTSSASKVTKTNTWQDAEAGTSGATSGQYVHSRDPTGNESTMAYAAILHEDRPVDPLPLPAAKPTAHSWRGSKASEAVASASDMLWRTNEPLEKALLYGDCHAIGAIRPPTDPPAPAPAPQIFLPQMSLAAPMRSSAAPYSNPASQDQESVADDSKTDGPLDLHGSADEGSDDSDNNIIAMLVSELAAMQKARADRKRNRQVNAAVEAALAQVSGFLNQWVNFSVTGYADAERFSIERVEAFCTLADEVCGPLDADFCMLAGEEAKLDRATEEVAGLLESFLAQVNAAAEEYKGDEAEIRRGASERKKRALHDVRQEISASVKASKSGFRSSSSRQGGDKGGDKGKEAGSSNRMLMAALRDL